MELYAAYATNMDPSLMAERCPHSPMRGNGWLEGWRLTFGGEDISWEGALATVVEDEADRVFVVLYELHDLDEQVLDHWDGVHLGYFQKLRVRVQTLDGDVAGLALRAQRLRGRPALGALSGHRGGRGRDGGRSRRLRGRAAHPALRVTGNLETRRNEPISARNDRASRPCAA